MLLKANVDGDIDDNNVASATAKFDFFYHFIFKNNTNSTCFAEMPTNFQHKIPKWYFIALKITKQKYRFHFEAIHSSINCTITYIFLSNLLRFCSVLFGFVRLCVCLRRKFYRRNKNCCNSRRKRWHFHHLPFFLHIFAWYA